MHLECPLRLQLDQDGTFEPAARWLPLAAARPAHRRTLDDRALVRWRWRDRRRRRSRAASTWRSASLPDSGFASRLRAQLAAVAAAARQVWLEVPEAAAVDHFELLRELGRQLRPYGARLGLEHAGERLGRIERLFEARARLRQARRRHHATAWPRTARAPTSCTGLVAMLHSLSLQVVAEGVNDAADAAALWAVRRRRADRPLGQRAGRQRRTEGSARAAPQGALSTISLPRVSSS